MTLEDMKDKINHIKDLKRHLTWNVISEVDNKYAFDLTN